MLSSQQLSLAPTAWSLTVSSVQRHIPWLWWICRQYIYISTVLGHVTTWVGIVSSGTKPDLGIAGRAINSIVTNDSNWCPRRTGVNTQDVETLLLTVVLQGRTSDQLLPSLPTQRGFAIFAICNQGVQRACLLVQNKELGDLTNLHTETDLGEGCVPVGW